MLNALILNLALFALPGFALAENPPADAALYSGWLKMYDLDFDGAHQIFAAWKRNHPADPMGPASNAAAYLFSELARLGALESELFVDDSRFAGRPRLRPDPAKGALFMQEVTQAERLADASLAKSGSDADALFAKSLTLGLRADYAGLIEKKTLAALKYTKDSRDYADRLMAVDPQAFDGYLAPGLENYLLSLKPAPLRLLLRMTGSNIDREKGLEQMRKAASGGHYLEPFAKLLLAVAALRDNNPARARDILGELHRRFPNNVLYSREIERIDKMRK